MSKAHLHQRQLKLSKIPNERRYVPTSLFAKVDPTVGSRLSTTIYLTGTHEIY